MINMSNLIQGTIAGRIAKQQRERIIGYVKGEPETLADFSKAIYKHMCKKLGKKNIEGFTIAYDLRSGHVRINGTWAKDGKFVGYLKVKVAMQGLTTVIVQSGVHENQNGFTVSGSTALKSDYPLVYKDLQKMQVWGQLAEQFEYTVVVK